MAINKRDTRRANVKAMATKDAPEGKLHFIDMYISDGNEKTSIRRYFKSDAEKQAYVKALKGMK